MAPHGADHRRHRCSAAAGVDITDMYPYGVGHRAGPVTSRRGLQAEDKLFDNLRDPAMPRPHPPGTGATGGRLGRPAGHARTTRHAHRFQKTENKQYTGQAHHRDRRAAQPGLDRAVFDLLLGGEDDIGTIYFSMSEENVRRQFTLPWIKDLHRRRRL